MGRAESRPRERQSRRLSSRLRRAAGASSLPFLSRLSRAASRLALALPLLAGAAVFASAASADVLVSNVGKDNSRSTSADGTFAQSFTTASKASLASIELEVRTTESDFDIDDLTVTIAAASGGNPGSTLATLGKPGSISDASRPVFTAPSDTDLAADSTYFVVIAYAGGDNEWTLHYTTRQTEDSGGKTGWSIGNSRHTRSQSGTWSSRSNPYQIRVNGTVTPNAAPTATGNTITVDQDGTYTFSVSDFPFEDADGDTLQSVRINNRPVKGTMQLDGAPVPIGQAISVADIEDGKLTYAPAAGESGTTYANFSFRVSDGTDQSGTVVMIIDVTPTVLPVVQFESTAVSFSESLRFDSIRVQITGTRKGDVSVDYAISSSGSNAATPCPAGSAVSSCANAGYDFYDTLDGETVIDYSRTTTFAAQLSPPFIVTVISLVPDTAVEGDETFTVTLSNPIGATLGTNSVLTVTIVDDDEAPALQTVGISSATGPYAKGEPIEVTATFSAAVTVNTSGGTPRIPLVIGGVTRYATYQSGSATTELVFSYTPVAGDADADGVTIAASTLQLNGGTIKVGTTDATLTHPAVVAAATNAVDTAAPMRQGDPATNENGTEIVLTYDEALTAESLATGNFDLEVGDDFRSPTAVAAAGSAVTLILSPALTHNQSAALTYYGGAIRDVAGNLASEFDNVTVTNNVAAAAAVDAVSFYADKPGPHALGDEIQVDVGFTVMVTVTGAPRIALDIGGVTRYAVYDSVRSDARVVAFSYTVAAGDNDTDGVSIDANAIDLNNGTIRSGTADAALAHPAVADHANHTVDSVAPVLQSVGSNADGTQIVLTYDEALGALAATTGTGFVVIAPRTSFPQKPSAAAVDGMTVVLTLKPLQVMRVTDTVTLNLVASSGLKDVAGNPALTFNGQAVDNNVVSGPGVESVAITSNAGADDTYAIGDTVEATLTFNEAVEVDTASGIPHVGIYFSGNDRVCNAAYNRGSGGTALVFVCAVQEGDRDGNGVSVDQNSLTLNGGTIRSSATDADAVLLNPDLSGQTAHKADGVRPIFASAATDAAGTEIVLTMSEALGSAPPANAFAVTVAGASRAVTGTVAVMGRTARLTLDGAAVTADQAVEVSYTDPSAGDDAAALQDAVGNDAANFAREFEASGAPPVTTPVTTPVPPGSRTVRAVLYPRSKWSATGNTGQYLLVDWREVDGRSCATGYDVQFDSNTESDFPPRWQGQGDPITDARGAGQRYWPPLYTFRHHGIWNSGIAREQVRVVCTGDERIVGVTVAHRGTALPRWEESGEQQAVLPAVRLSAGSESAAEGDALEFTLTRTGAAEADLAVNLDVSESGAMLAALPARVPIPAGETSVTFTVVTQDDDTEEAASVVTVAIAGDAERYALGEPSTAAVTVEDDDGRPRR